MVLLILALSEVIPVYSETPCSFTSAKQSSRKLLHSAPTADPLFSFFWYSQYSSHSSSWFLRSLEFLWGSDEERTSTPAAAEHPHFTGRCVCLWVCYVCLQVVLEFFWLAKWNFCLFKWIPGSVWILRSRNRWRMLVFLQRRLKSPKCSVLCEAAWHIKALQCLNLQECSVSSASAAASEWMLHCWEKPGDEACCYLWSLQLCWITGVFIQPCGGKKGKIHQIIFNSITGSPTAVQVCASEVKASRVPPLFPVMREIDCHCQHFLVFFF